MNCDDIVISQIMQPHEANPMGNIHGGVIMHYIDNAAAVVATRYAKGIAVTASVDRLDFFHPVYIGNLLLLRACLNWVGNTSMEIGVRVETEDLKTGTIKRIASSYLTFVALDDQGKPRKLPSLNITNDAMKLRFREAEARRKNRLAEKEAERQCLENPDECRLL
nr:acyl-CoA thioesterase [Desulfobulbaceae bacterium]